MRGVAFAYSSFSPVQLGTQGDSYFKVETKHGVPRNECDKIGHNDETHFPPYQFRGRTTRTRRRENSQNTRPTIDIDVVLMPVASNVHRRVRAITHQDFRLRAIAFSLFINAHNICLTSNSEISKFPFLMFLQVPISPNFRIFLFSRSFEFHISKFSSFHIFKLLYIFIYFLFLNFFFYFYSYF